MLKKALPLKLKILTGIVVASTLSVLLASGIFVYMESERLQGAMARELATLTSVAASNALGALAFADSDTASEVLSSLKANNHIMGAVIYNAGGKPFAHYNRASNSQSLPAGFPNTAPNIGEEYHADYMALSDQLVSEGETVGTIYIRADLLELQQVTKQFLGIAVIAVILAIPFSFVLSLLIVKSVVKPIKDIVSALRNIAEGDGDLTQRINAPGNDELAELASSFNSFVEQIHDIVLKFRDTSVQFSTAAITLSEGTTLTSQGAEKQRSETDMVVSAVTEMTGSVQEVAHNVSNAAHDAEKADQQAQHGKVIVEKTMASIESLAIDIEQASDVITQLRQESQNIGAVLEVIGGIAEQTNLLALNAAIEAARAGEQGRGFAVVADEVRTLASRTQTSTQEIQEMIDRLQAGANKAVDAMEKGKLQAAESVSSATSAHESLQEITESVNVIKDMTQQIACASEEQNAVTEEINRNIVGISVIATETSERSQGIALSSSELAQQAEALNGLINRFKL
ncbi:MAG: methyl-accepting chemotaxis protein [Oceanicoccus sp.]|jgi:methyl-accepting chemotaxis protein